jgi:hypothetical protein
MPKGYTTKTEIENYILQTIDVTFNSQIDSWIESIEKYIDKFTGRNFVADSVATIKIYDGNGTRELLIDDCVQITKIEIDDEEIDSDDYYIYPANETCKNRIVLSDAIFTRDYQNIEVTAKWGYSVFCPDDITLATTVLVAGIINYSDKSKGKVRSQTIGRYSVTYSDDQGWNDIKKVEEILKYYKKYTF